MQDPTPYPFNHSRNDDMADRMKRVQAQKAVQDITKTHTEKQAEAEGSCAKVGLAKPDMFK